MENIKTELSLFTLSSQTNWISGYLAVAALFGSCLQGRGCSRIARNERRWDNSHCLSSLFILLPARRAPLGSLDRLNCSTHAIEVNYLTQILFWVRNALLRLFQGTKKTTTQIFPVKTLQVLELPFRISSEPEQFQPLKLLGIAMKIS